MIGRQPAQQRHRIVVATDLQLLASAVQPLGRLGERRRVQHLPVFARGDDGVELRPGIDAQPIGQRQAKLEHSTSASALTVSRAWRPGMLKWWTMLPS